MPEPPGESDLRALASRFEEVEDRIRSLITFAPHGQRGELLTEALALLIELRREDYRGPHRRRVHRRTGALGEAHRGGRPSEIVGEAARPGSQDSLRAGPVRVPAPTANFTPRDQPTSIGRPGWRGRHATPADLTDMSLEAVTADVDRQGKRWPLGAWAEMNSPTIGRRASSRGTFHRVGSDGFVQVSSRGSESEVCIPLEGKTFDVFSAPTPPFHPHCRHYLIPVEKV